MDKIAAEAFVEISTKRRDAKDFVPLAETLTLLGNKVAATKVRQGKRGMDAVSSICVTTQKKLCKQFNVVKRKPLPLTDARIKACLWPRLSYIWGCVLTA
jgi:hypothetical protein